MTRSAEAGDTEAQIALADVYREGRLAPQNSAKAAQWYAGAIASSPYAAWRLGELFEAGDGLPRNEGQAVKLYLLAAAAGFAPAQNSLGVLYLDGVGVERDLERAQTWFRKSASAGFPNAFLNLAVTYAHGLGVAQDRAIAFALALAADDLGAPDAAAVLAEMRDEFLKWKKPAR